MLRGGTFYCRVWVPKDVAPVIGRRMVVTSLRTKDPKIARTRLARKTVELAELFERARTKVADLSSAPKPPEAELRMKAKEHAMAVVERAYVDQNTLFEQATKDPTRLWSGALTPLPAPSEHYDQVTHYDRLVEDGDLDAVLAYLQQFRLRKRVSDLSRMRATGNLAEFVALAGRLLPWLETGASVMFVEG